MLGMAYTLHLGLLTDSQRLTRFASGRGSGPSPMGQALRVSRWNPQATVLSSVLDKEQMQ